MLLKSPPKLNDSFEIAIDHRDKDLSEMKTDNYTVGPFCHSGHINP